MRPPPSALSTITGWGRVLAALLVVCLAAGCDGSDDIGATGALPDIPARVVTGTFQLTLDTQHAALSQTTLDPVVAPISITALEGGSPLMLDARVKRIPARAGLLWVEVFIENHLTDALRDVTLRVDLPVSEDLYDFSNNPYAEPTAERVIRVGGIGPEGVGRVALGFSTAQPRHEMKLSVSGTATRRVAAASSPLAMAPDGSEVWVAAPDLNQVAVIDARTDARVAQVAVPGRPVSVGITADGALVLVASAGSNQVTVIDRAARAVVQTLGESDGIGREPRQLLVSPDGSRAYVSAYVGDTVTALQRAGRRFRVAGTAAVGRRPLGMAMSPDGGTLLVSHYLPRGTTLQNEGWISVLTADPLAKTREIVILDPLNLDRAACLANLFMIPPMLVTSEGVPTQLAGVFLEPGGSRGIVVGGRAPPTPVFERGPKAVSMSDLTSPRPGELTSSFLFFLDTRDPSRADRFLSRGMVERPVDQRYTRCEQFGEESEATVNDPIPGQPDQTVPRFTAFATGVNNLAETGQRRFVAYTRGGRLALTLAYNSDEISVMNAVTHHPVAQKSFTLSGASPTGLVLSPDGRKGYVSYANSLYVSVLDLSAYADPAQLPRPTFVPYEYREVPELPAPGLPGQPNKQLVRTVTNVPRTPAIRETQKVILTDRDPMDPVQRRGKILFESSNPDKYPKLASHRMGACGVCHPGGGNDGFLWGTMEGARRTLSLYGGVAGRGWLHASATHRTAADFADVIVKERLGGDLPPEDQAALAAFVTRGIPKLQPPAVDAGLAARGKAVFATACAGCHAGAAMTSGNPDPADPLGGGLVAGPRLYDVGTAIDDAHVILPKFFEQVLPKVDAEIIAKVRGDRDLGSGDPVQVLLDFRQRPDRKRGMLKAPSLVNVWDNVVFFHDGRFDRLEDAVSYLNTQLKLGLGTDDLKAVVEYLKTL